MALAALFSVACGGAAVACGAVPAEAQTLALAYRSGDTYGYTIHSVDNEAMGQGTTAVPIKFDLTAHETVTVKSVDSSGTADLSIALGAVTMKSSTAGVTTTVTGAPLPSVTNGRRVTIRQIPPAQEASMSQRTANTCVTRRCGESRQLSSRRAATLS